ncbi:ArnT family glycosyltransferase [Baekduia sp. Peel2402]|uniref:ArnT family glycosyltransferase n=1 Tax=Baekduia sp. Peel2402 TaxID=3458296 RepID=UPI00403E7CCA
MESSTLLTSPRLRAVPERVYARAGFALLCAGALIGYLVYPTYPNYDSAYSLIWGRELVDGILPSFDAYRAPTQHPLAVVVGAVLSLLGEDAAPRAWLLLSVASFCLLVAGVYRLGRAAFGPWVGLVAALLVCSRLDYAFLAARGYIDVAYLALVAWAAARETETPRAGKPVWILLTLAGLLRPEAWILLGLYWLWMAWPPAARRDVRSRVRTALVAAIAPVLWVLSDLIATGDPLFSLNHTSSLANDLQRTKPASEAPSFAIHSLNGTLKWPVLIGAVLGIALAARFAPRRAAVLGAITASGLFTFGAIAAAGLSVIDRYLAITAVGLIVFAAFAIAGFTVLPPGHPAYRAWIVGAAVVAVGGAAFTATHLHPGYIDRELTTRRELRQELARLAKTPAFTLARRCGVVSVPNHKLIPDVRWILHADEDQVRARTDLDDFGQQTKGVQVFVTGPTMLTNSTYGPFVPGSRDDARIQVPGPGLRQIDRTEHFLAYAAC